MQTTVINLFGAPGKGKSATMHAIMKELKIRGIEAEMANEFAKECVWKERSHELHDQIWVFANQVRRLEVLKNKVEYVVTDCPIMLGTIYNGLYQYKIPYLNELILHKHMEFQNINFLVNNDTTKYSQNGRLQNKIESDLIQGKIKSMLWSSDFIWSEFDVNGVDYSKLTDECIIYAESLRKKV